MPISGTTVCSARKRDGSACQQPAMPDGRCRMHGGKRLTGIAHPGLTAGGRFSKYRPARLADHYETARRDPELLSLRENIALLDSRLADVLQQASNRES